MLRKLWVRLVESGPATRDESVDWCRDHRVDAAQWARSIDARLWAEAEAFSREQQEVAGRKSKELGLRVGGAGFSELLYFLVRLTRPEAIVETGVAFGFSSRAFLRALAENGGPARLYSSDFPYFRLTDPERIIGCLVEPDLHGHWSLLIGSDRQNLKRIVHDVPRIDLFHYDSDKSYSGRQFALRTLGPKLGKDALILFDDIGDNSHFRNFVRRHGRSHLVFESGGKWIGLTGGPELLYSNAGICVKSEDAAQPAAPSRAST
ncbi:MAG TPA: class I SAM-dependent methyltransferase [Sphingomicrobium sp.]|nr:class I SAM-dependent methyltransferase [Sphingomicrobium sp.]